MSGDTLKSSAQKVQRVLAEKGFTLEVREFPEGTRTAAQAAEAVGCAVGQIAKSLIFRAKVSDRPLLAIASGANRVDERALSRLLGEKIARADADFVRAKTGFAIGGVPPVGHLEKPVTFIDRDLMAYEVIWAAAGTPHAVFALKPADLVALTEGEVADIKKL